MDGGPWAHIILGAVVPDRVSRTREWDIVLEDTHEDVVA
jgi:hypothetical protein